jgi:RNA polymerase sigma-70 factor (ECF subfamily)
VRQRVFVCSGRNDDGEDVDPIQLAVGDRGAEPEFANQMSAAAVRLESAVGELPERQRQAFLLRAWEGLNVAETAAAMGCSEGSVKTHYSRAVHRLREVLENDWP